ncbi:integrase [Neosynechococcus sphagnicola sy1]|uniref:Integrase n=1 Tax=Neosynechococcus sphagnicola sy1 TaxID=1497020 RepID=A0A098TFL7_9CYAN|nr:tyrosine-type recombinase/integrase [Neosynechococcus sphagnicola]KGF71355.1 integrase [Neosynechococcus sphagnicola sy1]
MKNQRNGQAAILDREQLKLLFWELSPKYRALFGICYFTGCRISEALALTREDIVSDRIVFRAITTKTKATREVVMNPALTALLSTYGLPESGYLFPGKSEGQMSSQAADLALRKAADWVGLQGVSTHSFRRTSLTQMACAGIPLCSIQTISGHSSLDALQRYLAVSEEQKRDAISVLGF